MAVTLFEIAGKLVLDKGDFEKDIVNAEKSGNNLGSKLSKGISLGTKALSVGIAAAGAGFVALTKNAMSNYAKYEQLVGGVETLFGSSAQTVLGNANKAFKTAGLSMNEYMETATSTAAAMIKSLGGDTAKAAQMTDMAIIDMSDNVNKMGTSMDAIQNAYSGFAKGNFTMLDNLKLGYGGTKTEMQRLLKDAQRIQKEHGKSVKYNINNYADMVEAIHVVQTEMGITGTTQKEASTTIEGSVKAMSASWQNFMTVLGTGRKRQIKRAMKDMTESFQTAAKNIGQRLGMIAEGLSTAVKALAPMLKTELPGLLKKLLPSLISGAAALISGLGQALPSLLQALWEVLPQALTDLTNAGIDIINSVFGTNIPHIDQIKFPTAEELTTKANEIIDGINDVFGLNLPHIEDIKLPDITGLAEKVTTWWNGDSGPKAILQNICNWTLQLFNTPTEDGATIGEHIGKWWEGVVSFAQGALSWVLGEPDAPSAHELGETLRTGIENWWKAVKGAAEAILKWLLGSPDMQDKGGEQTKGKIRVWWDTLIKPALKSILNFTLGLFGLPDVDEMIRSLKEWWDGLIDSVRDYFVINIIPKLGGVPTTPDGKWDVSNMPHADTSGIDYSDTNFAKGLNYVPYDNYAASLHRGEAVLNRAQAERWRDSQQGGVDTKAIAAAVAGAIRSAMQGIAFEINGERVADMVTERINRNIGNLAAEGRYAW